MCVVMFAREFRVMEPFRFNAKIIHPATCVVASATMGGKSHFIRSLLMRRMIDPWPAKIVYIYFYYSKDFEVLRDIPGLTFMQGIPANICDENFLDKTEPSLIVLDDVMNNLDNNVLSLFTRGCHHLNRSCILTLQNIFFQNPVVRTISLNAHYIVVFKCPRDVLQLEALGRQMYPGKSKSFLEAYKYATQRDYGYLFLDLRSLTPENLRIRTTVCGETEDKHQRILVVSDRGMDTYVLVPTSEMASLKPLHQLPPPLPLQPPLSCARKSSFARTKTRRPSEKHRRVPASKASRQSKKTAARKQPRFRRVRSKVRRVFKVRRR